MESKRQNVIRVADNVSFAPRGIDYDLEAGVVYTAQWDDYNGIPSLKITADFSMPENLYETESSKKFVNKVLNSFNRSNRTVGVLLNGLKGTGKTIMAKQIATKANLPIILIDSNFPTYAMPKLSDKLAERSVCIILDELDKFRRVDDESGLLQLFDGICTAGNNLIIATCNDMDRISDCLQDRCSRIKYSKTFKAMDKEQIMNLIEATKWSTEFQSKWDEPKDIPEVISEYIMKNFKVISFDNVVSFLDEINHNTGDDWDEILRDMNITICE